MLNRISRLLCLVLVVGLTVDAGAATVFDSTGGSPTIYGGSGTAGYTFTVNQALQVTELDMYAGLGLSSAATPVGIWDSGGTLLTSAAINNISPQTTTPSAGGGVFNGAFITPIVLQPGNYTIGAFGNGSDAVRYGGAIIAAPGVSYGSGVLTSSASLTQPVGSPVPGLGLFGPSFQASLVAVPLPSAAWSGIVLLGLLGALGGVTRIGRAREPKRG